MIIFNILSEISSLKNGNKGKKREKADYFLYFYYLRIKSSKTIITLQSYPIPKLLHETYLPYFHTYKHKQPCKKLTYNMEKVKCICISFALGKR